MKIKHKKKFGKIFKCTPRSLMRWVNQYKKEGNVNKHNNLLYAVPYQHFTNSIENYFSMLKSRLQKLEGLKYENLKENIQKVISEIPKEKYENIFKGAY